jgi:hypothetical protein
VGAGNDPSEESVCSDLYHRGPARSLTLAPLSGDGEAGRWLVEPLPDGRGSVRGFARASELKWRCGFALVSLADRDRCRLAGLAGHL